MKFEITPIINGKARTFQIEKVAVTGTTESYLVTIKDRSVILQTNRLFFRRRRLMHRKGSWTVIEGTFKNPYAIEKITAEIEKQDPLPSK